MQNSLNLTKHPLAAALKNLKMLRAVYRLSLAALDVYALGVILYFVLRPITGDGIWYVFIGSNVVQWGFFPALILLPAFLLIRHWPRAGLFALHLLLLTFTFGGMFLPGRANAAPEGSQVLTVMTYNSANMLAPPDVLAAMLRDSDADIIALQELGPDQAEALENDLLDVYPYQVLNPGFITGKGLLSRYPITDYEVFDILERRPYIDATLDVDGEPLRVFVAHPPAPGITGGVNAIGHIPNHAEEIRRLLLRADVDAPTLLLGDFNVTDQGDNYDLMTEAGYTDVFRDVGWGLGATYPARFVPFALWRIDYVWASPHFLPLTSHVGVAAGSDHLPVVADVAWLAGE